jgi:hypothetical protein
VPNCETVAWHQNFSVEKCPECLQPLEKIPSRKVVGGYFLKCSRKESHPWEVVLFRNKQTRKWERAKPKAQGHPDAHSK